MSRLEVLIGTNILRPADQQVARSMPAWTGLQGYGDSQTSIGEDRIIRMLPFVCLGDSGCVNATSLCFVGFSVSSLPLVRGATNQMADDEPDVDLSCI